ncbi:hypothetical protein CJO36_01050 [Megasphaera elsdenii]|uniref:hypothetical protein n=1 Tax=Megasphaera elsdenii TaxID=907 RepID=UPI000BA56EED|nr:hypothetical protein [Megasphaera elsdenii]PAK20782.1 hypothetical protein CJO36_01050 [Megasphaera elsdenii]
MKKWKQAMLAALFCTCTTLTGLAADTAKPVPAEAAAQPQAAETATDKTAEKASVPTDPLAGHTGKIIDKYYLTKGSTYKDVTTLLQTIDSHRTSLDAKDRPYYFRVDKDLTDKYFRRVRAYDDKTTEQIGEYLVAKDKSSVWRMDTSHEGLIYGSAEKMMKKSRIIIYPRYLALGSKGLVALQTPGNVPYDLTAKSLNESVAKIGEDNTIIPVKTGQVDILADVTVGDIKETASRRISVVTQADLERMAYNAYLTQLYMDTYWNWGGPFYRDWGWHRPPPPPPRHGHRPPPRR